MCGRPSQAGSLPTSPGSHSQFVECPSKFSQRGKANAPKTDSLKIICPHVTAPGNVNKVADNLEEATFPAVLSRCANTQKSKDCASVWVCESHTSTLTSTGDCTTVTLAQLLGCRLRRRPDLGSSLSSEFTSCGPSSRQHCLKEPSFLTCKVKLMTAPTQVGGCHGVKWGDASDC